MIIAIGGGIRTGKTLLLTILGYLGYLSGIEIYSNYHTKFSEYISPVEVLDFELKDCWLLGDEMHTVIDSRSNKSINRLYSYFITQSGKRNVSILWTSQLLGSVDLRLRDLSHILIFAQKLIKSKKFKYSITDRIRFATKYVPFKKAEQFYPLYETEEIIYPLELDASDVVDYEELLLIYEDAPTKKAFVMTLRRDIPFISYDIASSVYDYIKAGKKERAKRLIGL